MNIILTTKYTWKCIVKGKFFTLVTLVNKEGLVPCSRLCLFNVNIHYIINIIMQVNAFIALPGGVGTMEELTEILTWLVSKYINSCMMYGWPFIQIISRMF